MVNYFTTERIVQGSVISTKVDKKNNILDYHLNNNKQWVSRIEFDILNLKFQIYKLKDGLSMLGYTWDERERKEKLLKSKKIELKKLQLEYKKFTKSYNYAARGN